MHADDDLLLKALSRQTFHPRMDSPYLAYTGLFYPPTLGDDFEDYESPEFEGMLGGHSEEEAPHGGMRSRRAMAAVQGEHISLGAQRKGHMPVSEEKEGRGLHGGAPEPTGPQVVIPTNSSFLDPLNAFAPYRLQFGNTSYIGGLTWSNSKDDGRGVFAPSFQARRSINGRADHDDFQDYNMLGMVMDCKMIEGMGMEHATMLMNGVTMRGMPMWMSNAHSEMNGMRARELLGVQAEKFFAQPKLFTLLARDMQVRAPASYVCSSPCPLHAWQPASSSPVGLHIYLSVMRDQVTTQIDLTDSATMSSMNKWADANVLSAGAPTVAVPSSCHA